MAAALMADFSNSCSAGRGAYTAAHNKTVYASLTGFRRTTPPEPDSPDQRPTVEVTGHKAPQPGSEPRCSSLLSSYLSFACLTPPFSASPSPPLVARKPPQA
ncbi:uncharacterized protein LOC130748137 [Lotus japonicus]|uniref:uncharacterized protein LOC130748137 n=1 Tax=Lotus japonicus TaxID=34305 RepID=UPI00258FF886|nr:uncharacterized protein LOC130748137 [Lotus japonicus]